MPHKDPYKQIQYDRANAIIIDAKSQPCVDCGISYPWHVMDFDHREGNKRFNIGRTRHAGNKKLREEIAKCDVVCSNCHRLRHPPESRQLIAVP